MPEYNIEQKIKSLTDIVKISGFTNYTQNQFKVLDITFYHSGIMEGNESHEWLAQASIEAPSLNKALDKFNKKMNKVIPRIAFVSQCNISYAYEPYIIINNNYPKYCILNYIREGRPVGMMFRDEEINALKKIIPCRAVPDIFFYYWQNISSVEGDVSRLLLMFAAVDIFVGNSNKTLKRQAIFGKKLENSLYRSNYINPQKAGLRNRLTHGQYLKRSDLKYIDLVYKAIIKYLNRKIFNDDIVDQTVKAAPRSFVGNKEQYRPILLQNISPKNFKLNLENVIKEFGEIVKTNKAQSSSLKVVQGKSAMRIAKLIGLNPY